MIQVVLAGRVGDDCYSAFVVWQRLPRRIAEEGRELHRRGLDVRRDGFKARYTVAPPPQAVLVE